MAVVTAAVVAAAALFVLGGCGGDGADDGADDGAGGGSDEPAAVELEGTEWSLVRWRESGLDPLDFTITAAFADGQVSGSSAVNTYSGSYTTGPGNDFSTGKLAATMMAGPDADMEAESVYLRLLEDAASAHLAGNTLTLFGSDGAETLVFSAGE